MDLGIQIDDSLLLLAQAAPQAAQEITQARDLVKAALAKVVMAGANGAGPPPASGTSPGNQFPGSTPGAR